MSADAFRQLVEQGDVAAVRAALAADPRLANSPIRWHLNQDNESDPLHYVSDCVGNGWLNDDSAAAIAIALLDAGAELEGSAGSESPLIAAASLGAEAVAGVLIAAGANSEAHSIFGARALHWAAWTGALRTVERLVAGGAELEPACTEFGATPLFWAVHGYGPRGPKQKKDQLGAAQCLIGAGASVRVANRHGLSAIELAKSCARDDMYVLLRDAAAA
jgi:ankyrin repeat protein